MTLNGEKILSVAEIADAFGMPDYTLRSYIGVLKRKNEDICKEIFKEFKTGDKPDIYVGTEGLLYLYHKVCDPEDFPKILPLIKECVLDTSGDLIADILSVIEKYQPEEEKETRYYREKYHPDKSGVPEADKEAKMWCGRMTAMMKENKNYLMKVGPAGVVMRKIYAKMRNVYGIVFEQELKEFYNKYNLIDKPDVSKMRLVQEKEQLMSLYQSILVDIISEEKLK